MGHSCRKLLWDTLTGLLWDTLTGHSCRTLLGHSYGPLLSDTLVRHSCETLNERFARDFLKKSHVKSPKRAFRRRHPQKLTRQSLQNERFVRDLQTPIGAHTSRSPAKQFRDSSPSRQHPLTRQSQWDSDIHLYKGTLRGCKTSVSYETSSKSHASSLQKERFVRDILQKSHVKSPKRAFRTRLPQKVTRQVSKTSVSYETSSKTHMSKSAKRAFRTRLPPKVKRKHPSEPQPCQAVSRFRPLQTTSAHRPIPM